MHDIMIDPDRWVLRMLYWGDLDDDDIALAYRMRCWQWRRT